MPSHDPLRRSWWVGVYASGTLHVAFLATAIGAHLLGIALPFLSITPPVSRQIVLISGFAPPRDNEEEHRVFVELKALSERDRAEPETVDPAIDSANAVAVPAEVDDPQTIAAASESRSLGQFIKKRVDTASADAEELSEEERLARLKKLSGQLGQVSTEKSLDGVADTLSKFLGTEKRAERPAEKPVAGEFDFATAQLHDVRREPLDDGGFRYTSVLVDAEGRQLESAMDDADGESAYRVMELIKGNPLLEKVYRSIVMSLMDKVTKEAAEKIPAKKESPPSP